MANARWPIRWRPCAKAAIQVQGTINGYGERCGNANLCSIIPDLELKLGLACLPEGQPGQTVRAVALCGRSGQPGPG